MARMEGEKDLNAAIPEALWDDLDAISGEFRPFKKKHLVAAALAAFIRMSHRQQDEAIGEAQRAYYRRSVSGGSKDAEALDRLERQQDEQEERPRRRKASG